MSKKYYTIEVLGKAPAAAQVGFIDKVTGQPQNSSIHNVILSVGETTIPNYSTAWGILKRDAQKKLNGEIEFLNWGDPKGEQIQIRYLPNCNSVSMEYQKEKKLEPSHEDSEISVMIGQNKYDEVEEKYLVMLIKHHGLNQDNKSRNPRNNFVLFKQVDVAEGLDAQAMDVEKSIEAQQMVIATRDNEEKLYVMAKIFEIDPDLPDSYIFKQLIAQAQNYKNFFRILEHYAKRYKENLIRAKELNILDFTAEDAVVIVVNSKKDVLLNDVTGKDADEKIEWITDHIHEPLVFYALDRLGNVLQDYAENIN